jgi:hypothetical protein
MTADNTSWRAFPNGDQEYGMRSVAAQPGMMHKAVWGKPTIAAVPHAVLHLQVHDQDHIGPERARMAIECSCKHGKHAWACCAILGETRTSKPAGQILSHNTSP